MLFDKYSSNAKCFLPQCIKVQTLAGQTFGIVLIVWMKQVTNPRVGPFFLRLGTDWGHMCLKLFPFQATWSARSHTTQSSCWRGDRIETGIRPQNYLYSRVIDNNAEKLCNLPKVSHLVSGRTGIWMRMIWLQSLYPLNSFLCMLCVLLWEYGHCHIWLYSYHHNQIHPQLELKLA